MSDSNAGAPATAEAEQPRANMKVKRAPPPPPEDGINFAAAPVGMYDMYDEIDNETNTDCLDGADGQQSIAAENQHSTIRYRSSLVIDEQSLRNMAESRLGLSWTPEDFIRNFEFAGLNLLDNVENPGRLNWFGRKPGNNGGTSYLAQIAADQDSMLDLNATMAKVCLMNHGDIINVCFWLKRYNKDLAPPMDISYDLGSSSDDSEPSPGQDSGDNE